MHARLSILVRIIPFVLVMGGSAPATHTWAQEGTPNPRPGRLYALLVGVREYKTPALRPLK